MNTYIEDLIRDAQQTQAGRAVPPERILAKLPAGGARRSRVRRRGTLMVAAACAVGLVVAALPVAIRLGVTERAPVAGARGWSGTVPDFYDLESPREVWPDAVHAIPDTLPDGARYTVSAVLGGGRYLVKSDAPYGARPEEIPFWPIVFDSAQGTIRPLSYRLSFLEGSDLGDVFVAGDRALWVLHRRSGAYELWGVSLSGETAPGRIMTWPAGGTAHPIGVDGEVTYWRYTGRARPSGVYRVALSTPEPSLVAGTEWYEDVGAFPWVSTAGQRRGDLLNVVTGEHRPWTANEGAESVDCNPVVCLGLTRERYVTVQRLDGGGYQRLPYRQSSLPFAQSAAGGRFGIGSFPSLDGQTWIWDRVTGAAAAMPRVYLTATRMMPKTLVQFEDVAGGKYVLDLAAIK